MLGITFDLPGGYDLYWNYFLKQLTVIDEGLDPAENAVGDGYEAYIHLSYLPDDETVDSFVSAISEYDNTVEDIQKGY